MAPGLGREGERKGGAGGRPRGNPGGCGEGCPRGFPPPGMSRPEAVLCRGWAAGGFRGWEPVGMIIYGPPGLVLPGGPWAASRAVGRAWRYVLLGAGCLGSAGRLT